MKAGGDGALPAGTAWVDAFVFDVNGQARGKRLPAAAWPGVLRDGLAFSGSALVLDATGAARAPCGIGGADGDPDAVARVVPGTLAPVPWAEAPTAQALLSMPDRVAIDPRAILARVVARLAADRLFPVVACELEFYLVRVDRRGRPHPGAPGHLSPGAVEAAAPLLHALHAALAAQGIEAGPIVGEYGPGQFEINLPHRADALRAADEAALFRRAAAGVARRHGSRATFMAKPFADRAGSGLHVHVNLLDAAGRNLFEDSAVVQRAVAGMQALYAESMLICAPNFSAYRRLGGSFVAARASVAANRRDVAFRQPLAGPPRIEHRVASADASPHLVVAAVLAAAHAGITRGLAPLEVPAPPDWFAALGAWAEGRVLRDYIGNDLIAVLAALRRAEAAALFTSVSPSEYEFYL